MNRKKGQKISYVEPGSIAEEMEIQAGDILLSVNDSQPEDVLDYRYLIHDEYLEVVIVKPWGEEWVLQIEKDFDEDLGISFENGLMDEYRSCRNKCIFCFIDQMPKGMRDTLYFKDDDMRLSFLQGNYVTLTNMKEKDIERIIRYHLEPINISVQTTIPELRCKMLHNRFAGQALKHMDRLFQGRIRMNGQIVLCKGVNDGENLRICIRDLMNYLPYLESVSVVPAGLTKYRKGLYPLESFTKEEAGEVIDLIEAYQEQAYEKYGLHFIHASDEWYFLAERDFPEEERYDGYLQLENGVGMMRLLTDEYQSALGEFRDKKGKEGPGKTSCVHTVRKISLATGCLAAKTIEEFAGELMEICPEISIRVYPIRNDFFGEKITVSGLLTGTDLIKQLRGRELGEELLLPPNVLRSGENVFLDDITLEQLEAALNIKAVISGSSGQDLLDSFLGRSRMHPAPAVPPDQKDEGLVYSRMYTR